MIIHMSHTTITGPGFRPGQHVTRWCMSPNWTDLKVCTYHDSKIVIVKVFGNKLIAIA